MWGSPVKTTMTGTRVWDLFPPGHLAVMKVLWVHMVFHTAHLIECAVECTLHSGAMRCKSVSRMSQVPFQSPPANLAAGNTNIRNKDKQSLSSKQIPDESETMHVQGLLLLAQLCSHLSPMKGQPQTPGPLILELELASWSQFCHFKIHLMMGLVDLQ